MKDRDNWFRPGRAHWWVAAIGVVGIGLHALVVPARWLEFSYDGVELFMLAAIVWAIRHHQPRPARPWWLLAGGLGLLVVGDVVYNALTRMNGGEEVYPSLADAMYVASYGVLAAGLIAVQRARRRRKDPTAMLDAALVAVVAAATTWVYLVDPSSYGNVPLLEGVVSAAYPIGDVVLLGFLVRLLISSPRRPPAEKVLTIGIGLLLLADVTYARLALSGSYVVGGWLDVVYHLSYLCLPVAAAHPSMRTLVIPDAGLAPSERSRLWLLSVVSLVLPAFAVGEIAAGATHKAIILAAASAGAFFLLTFRTGALNTSLVRALAGERSARARETESLERERILRELGIALVGTLDRDDICSAAADHARRLGGPGGEATVFMTAGAVTAVSASDGFGPVDPSWVHRCELPPEVEAVLERRHSAIVNPDVGPLPMAGLPAHLSTRRLVVTPVFIGGRRAGLAVVAPANPVDQPERLAAACDALGSAVSVALDAAELSEQLLDERSGERFEAMIRHSSDIVMVLRSDSTIRFVSPSATRVLGWELEGVIDRPLTELVHPEDSERLAGALIAVVARPGVHAPFEFRARHSSGDWRFLEAIGTCLADDAALGGVVINVRDATERVTLEHELTQQALHDGLTGLANRDLFLRRVDDAMDRADGTRFQVEILFVDLDDFKTVNDSLGHRVGDEVLVAVADKLRRCVRTADTVARFGGDEFAVLLADGWENCAVVAERIVEAMRVPVQVDGQHVTVLASVGLASSSTRTDASDLLRQADLAMYVAKTEGKARWVAFRPEMLEQFLDELQLERALRAAVADDRLEVHFQPIIDLATGAFTGAEALARWSDPELGPVPPTTFIPVAERSELIEIIGRFVLGRACRWASRWEQESGRTLSHIAVNVSARQLRGASLVNDVRSALAESGLVPDKLVLEITESMLIDEGDAVIVRLEALRRLGVRIAIDDFGTGYSSLSYLERLPVDVLKIDRAFIAGLLDPGERSLVPAILELARTLGLATVAEGVETGEHGRRLAELGCELAQGFHYSRPIPEGRVAEVVAGLRIAPAGGARRRRRGVTPTP